MIWPRTVMADILDPDLDLRRSDDHAWRRAGAIVTDCRSLWGRLTMDRANLTDRRLSLEAALLRQECQSCEIKSVRSDQQLAGVLAKDMQSEYTRQVFKSNLWTLGPDNRAPSSRRRTLTSPQSCSRGSPVDAAAAAQLNEQMTARRQGGAHEDDGDNVMTTGFVDPVQVVLIGEAEITLPKSPAATPVIAAIVTVMSILVNAVNWLFCPRRRAADKDAGEWPGTQQCINDHLNRFEARLHRACLDG